MMVCLGWYYLITTTKQEQGTSFTQFVFQLSEQN